MNKLEKIKKRDFNLETRVLGILHEVMYWETCPINYSKAIKKYLKLIKYI